MTAIPAEAIQLDPPLQLMLRLCGLDHQMMVASRQLEARFGITERQRQVLALVIIQPDISAARLADFLQLHPTTVAGILARLRQRRFLTSTNDRTDRRRMLLAATERGRRAAQLGSVEGAIERAVVAMPPTQLDGLRVVVEALVRELGQKAPTVSEQP